MQKLADKKILITGASGFLGTHLAERCYAEGAKVYGIDIRKPFDERIWAGFSEQGVVSDTSEDLLIENKFDIIYHLAGGASVGLSVQDPVVDFNSLLPPTLTFLTWIHKYSPSAHFVLFSSAAVYGNPESLPITEETPLKPLSPYGIHKMLAEQMLIQYSKYYNIRVSILRIFSAFGEGLRKQLFWDVATRYKNAVADAKGGNVQIQLFGTGRESRDFIHGKDVAQAAVLIGASQSEKTEVFNIAAGKEIEIKEAIGYLFTNAKPRPEITFGGVNRVGDPERWRADVSKLEALGFKIEKEVSLSLNDLLNWFINQ